MVIIIQLMYIMAKTQVLYACIILVSCCVVCTRLLLSVWSVVVVLNVDPNEL